MQELSPLSIRLKQAMDWLKRNKGMLQRDIAKQMGITPVSLSRAIARISQKYDADFIIAFNEATGNNFSLKWFLEGEGDMLCIKKSNQDSAKDKEPTNISHEDFSALLRQNSELIEMLRKEIAALRQELQQMKFEHNYRKNTG